VTKNRCEESTQYIFLPLNEENHLILVHEEFVCLSVCHTSLAPSALHGCRP